MVVFHCPTCSLQYMNILFDIVRLLFQPICPPLDWSIDLSRLTKIADHYQTPTVASRLCCRAALFVPVLLNAKSKARLFNTIRIIKRRFLIQSLGLFRRARVELRSYSDWFGKYLVTSDRRCVPAVWERHLALSEQRGTTRLLKCGKKLDRFNPKIRLCNVSFAIHLTRRLFHLT